MRRATRTARPLTVTAVAVGTALALTGCALGDDAEVDPGVDVGTDDTGEEGAGTGPDPADQTEEDTGEPDDTLDRDATDDGGSPAVGTPDDGDDDGGSPAVGTPDRPQPGTCVDIGEAEDGVYEVFEAGSATIVVRENRLVVDSVDPATGWEYSIDEDDGDEVEIEFRRTDADDELDLEVEIDDGRVTAEICADDD